jgi:beta-glucosidase/6-phospho-beta-glucosidase/beta-galactosidase
MNPFQSFFIGGYECADQINKHGHRVNLLKETEHDKRVWKDYEDLVSTGIYTVREGICWSSVEISEYEYDFSEVKNRMDAAEAFGIQQIWDLVHFGYPDGLFPTHPRFNDRFVALCEAFARFYSHHSDQPLFVVPFNEISFLSWLSGEVGGTVPFVTKNGWEIKYRLCEAAINGIQTIQRLCSDAKILMVEPLIKIHSEEENDRQLIHDLNEIQFQAMDIVTGRICPELGGNSSLIDFVGVNYYWDCQWDHHKGPLPWPETEPKRAKLSDLLAEVYDRYEIPVVLTETGHYGDSRIPWLMEITQECKKAIESGVDLRAICLYPIIDRPDWDNLEAYCKCGLWDLDEQKNRIPDLPYIQTLQESLKELENFFKEPEGSTKVFTFSKAQ